MICICYIILTLANVDFPKIFLSATAVKKSEPMLSVEHAYDGIHVHIAHAFQKTYFD